LSVSTFFPFKGFGIEAFKLIALKAPVSWILVTFQKRDKKIYLGPLWSLYGNYLVKVIATDGANTITYTRTIEDLFIKFKQGSAIN